MIKLMLACGDETEKILSNLRFPYLMSPKYDGVRGHNQEGYVVSRNLRPLSNNNLQESYGWSKYFGYDGEFIVGEPYDKKVFNKTTSVVASHDKDTSDLRWYVFDYTEAGLHIPYYRRLEYIVYDNLVLAVPQTVVNNYEELLAIEESYLDLGYEGAMLRDPEGRYKEGRSTLKENILLKLKRFTDDEAVVIGFEERMHNANAKTLVKNGKAVRNHCADGLVGLDTLGAIRVRWKGIEFNIGSGFDAAEAQEVWDNQHKYLGQYCTFKYFAHGMIDAPRHPVFKGWRKKGT